MKSIGDVSNLNPASHSGKVLACRRIVNDDVPRMADEETVFFRPDAYGRMQSGCSRWSCGTEMPIAAGAALPQESVAAIPIP